MVKKIFIYGLIFILLAFSVLSLDLEEGTILNPSGTNARYILGNNFTDIEKVEVNSTSIRIETNVNNTFSYAPEVATDYTIYQNYFNVTSYDAYNLSTIDNFNISIDEHNYSTTTALIDVISLTENVTFTISADNYFSDTYTNNSNMNITMYPYTRIYANEFFTNTSVQNLTVLYDGINYTNSGNFTYVPIYNETTSITLYSDYADATAEVTADPYLQNYTFTLYTKNSIFITFKNEIGNVNFNDNASIDLSIIGDTLTNVSNTTVNNATYYIDNILADTYKLIYTKDGYNEREYFIDIENNQNYQITLYLLNDTLAEEILYTVEDADERPISGVIIKAKKLFIADSAYNIIGMCRTDNDGQCAISQEADKAHSYTLQDDSNILNIDPFVHYSLTKTFSFVSTGTFDLFDNYMGINSELSYNETTENFKFIFSTENGNSYEFCLNLYNMTGIRARETLITDSCINSSAGTLIINQNIDNQTIKAVGTVSINPLIPLDVIIRGGNLNLVPTFGTLGLLLSMIILMVLAAIGTSQSPATAIVMTLLGVTVTYLIGLINVGWGSVIGIIIVGVTIAYYTRT